MRDARITEFLGDGMHDFRMGFGELLELQEKTGNIGPFALYRRFMNDDWLVQDIYETCRIGLIGGGMAPKDAFAIATKYVKNRPPLENLNLARMILIAGLHGAPDEDEAGSKSAKVEESDDTIKSRDYYGNGAVMGYTPQEINAMSMHQIKAAFDGYSEHHSASSGGMSEKEKDELFEMVQEAQEKIDGL